MFGRHPHLPVNFYFSTKGTHVHSLVDHPLNLVGLGGMRTQPLGFIILRVQVTEITGYDEDIIFLVIPDESEFPRCVPLIIETCMLRRIVNVIKESELDRLSTSWVMAKASHLLSRQGTAVVDSDASGDGPAEGGATTPESSQSSKIDKIIFIKENVRLRLFQTQILECKSRLLLGESAHMMVMPLKASESQPGGAWPLPPGLHVLHMYARFKMSSSKVSVVVRNMSDCPIFLKKGIQVVGWFWPRPCPGRAIAQDGSCPGDRDHMGAHACNCPGGKTSGKVTLDGLSNWNPQNVAAAKELVLVFHDISVLDGNELGCMSAIEEEMCINDSESFKEQFRCIPPLLLEEVHVSLRDMLDAGVIPQPVPMVQCNGANVEKGWITELLCRLPRAQHMYQESRKH